MRQDVFNAVQNFQKKAEGLEPEAVRYLDRVIKLGRRNGKSKIVILLIQGRKLRRRVEQI